MCPIFDCWVHCGQVLSVTTMCSICAHWVFTPLSPVSVVTSCDYARTLTVSLFPTYFLRRSLRRILLYAMEVSCHVAAMMRTGLLYRKKTCVFGSRGVCSLSFECTSVVGAVNVEENLIGTHLQGSFRAKRAAEDEFAVFNIRTPSEAASQIVDAAHTKAIPA